MSNFLRVVFLDRDGVINKKQAEGNYVTNTGLFEFNEGIFETLEQFIKDGFKLIVITNQRGIARRLMSEDDLRDIHDYMRRGLRERGIEVLDVFFCPHGLDECSCRKPKPGMLQAATEKYNVNLKESVLISDDNRDVQMGKSFGVAKNILIETDNPRQILNYF